MKKLFTSESVTEGHPDKICDQISDAILDDALRQDPNSRVAIEVLTKNGGVNIAGEMTTKGYVDTTYIARQVIKNIGYDKSEYGIEYKTCTVWSQITEQSPDISQGVTAGRGLHKAQGAGDQGMMFGFACNETPELMPLPIMLAHKLAKKLAEVRKTNGLNFLRPDGKSQVTVEYGDNYKPLRLEAIVVSAQHNEDVQYRHLREGVIKKIIIPVCQELMDKDTKVYVNPTGAFIRGGPYADAGVTGRKIIVDTYGGMARHGGGCFSGKDPSKVDRSAAYAARYIAKNIVAASLADRCEIQLAYAIGVAEPVSIFVETFGTNKIPEEKISELIRKHFSLKPADILKELNLRRPIYLQTAAYGHFGRDEPDFTWEKTDKVEILKKEAKI